MHGATIKLILIGVAVDGKVSCKKFSRNAVRYRVQLWPKDNRKRTRRIGQYASGLSASIIVEVVSMKGNGGRFTSSRR